MALKVVLDEVLGVVLLNHTGDWSLAHDAVCSAPEHILMRMKCLDFI